MLLILLICPAIPVLLLSVKPTAVLVKLLVRNAVVVELVTASDVLKEEMESNVKLERVYKSL